MKNRLLLVLFLLFAFEIKAQDGEKTRELINRYKHRDGSGSIEIGHLLAKELVKNDTVFFRIMLKEKSVFDSWIDELQYDVFTVYESEDEVDDLLYKAFYEELKKLMLIRVEKFQDNTLFGKMAKKLKKKLIEIKIDFLD